jgi:PAS domain S-box-containing protein
VQRKTILILALTLSLVVALLAIVLDEQIRDRLGPAYWVIGLAIIGCILLVLTGYVWDRSLLQRLKMLHDVAERQKGADAKGENDQDEIIGLARNIERMAQSLQRVEASYRGIVEDQADLICRYRGDGRLTFVNAAYERFFGQKRQELIGKPFPLFSLALASRAAADGAAAETTRYEAALASPDGTQAWILWTQRAIQGPGSETVEYQAVGHDITLRKQAEAALLKAKEAAETADRAKSEFLAMVSHELRTPINGVLGFATLLRGTPLSVEQNEQVEMIRTSAETLESLIADILDLSKMEAGRLDIEQQAFALHKCVEEVCSFFAQKVRAAALTLDLAIAPDVPAIVHGDQTRLRQVLVNLVGNAIKFTDRGGVKIAVSCKPEEPAAGADRVPGLRLFFAIADTGIGIEPHKLDYLFKPFSQVDSSPTRRRGGTGLGLIISKRLCELMGGAISVESRPGEGSTFRFSIVVCQDRADPPHSAEPPATTRRAGK